jgi:phosphopantothenoylcysteine decarboxylase / phosphopantothenate---cysteine ligase
VSLNQSPNVVLGVGGGIAAYKAVALLRLLTESGAQVRVVPTAAALRFVGEPTWAALSGQPVATDVWADVHEVPHVRIGQQADLVLVAPATADLLAKAACGQADDLLTATLLMARSPVVFAPAMHTEMWEHPATQANVAKLRQRGAVIIEPGQGRLTGVDSGPGRLPEPEEIFAVASQILSARSAARSQGGAADLAGWRVIVTAGGTVEPIDPVRFIGNHSSGRQGIALAQTAVARGAAVTLIAANIADGVPLPAQAEVIRVQTAQQLQAALGEVLGDGRSHTAVVMAAAVADFRPLQVASAKLKKETGSIPEAIPVVANPDILAGLVSDRSAGRLATSLIIVGFAAETGDGQNSVLGHGRAKLRRKGVDLLVVNDVSDGQVFGQTHNAVTLLARSGSETPVARAGKAQIADAIWDRIVALAGVRI